MKATDNTGVMNRVEREELSSPERVRRILELYLEAPENIPAHLRDRCREWLCREEEWDVKDEVLREYFDKAMEISDETAEGDKLRFARISGRLGLTESGQ